MDQHVAVMAERLEVRWSVVTMIMIDVMDDKLAERFRNEPAS